MSKEDIEKFLEPPKRVRIRDIKVCIMEMQGVSGIICNFLFAYPYKDKSGGLIEVFNPSYRTSSMPEKAERSQEFSSKILLWQAYLNIKRKALRSNPDLKVLYEGPILRDDYSFLK